MTLAPWKKSYDQPRQHVKKQRHYFANKGLSSQSYGFSSHHVWIWELNSEENWAPQNWCFWTAVLKKTPVSPLDYKEIKPINPEGNQSWVFIGRTDAEAEAPILWPADSLEKTLMLGKTESSRRRGWQDEMVGWHHQLNGLVFEQALGVDDGQGSLTCYSPWGCKESDMTEQLNWTELNWECLSRTTRYLSSYMNYCPSLSF